MITRTFEWVEERLDRGAWFRRGLAAATLVLAFSLTAWGMKFADSALMAKADLMGVAAVIGAVAAIPLALLTMLFRGYVDSRI